MNSLNVQYHSGTSILHRLDGRAKILLLATWTPSIFLFVDIRILCLFLMAGLVLIAVSGIPFYKIRRTVLTMLGFVVLTAILTNILTPGYAGRYIASQHPLITIWGLSISRETVFYSFMLMVKYAAIFPMAILFVLTTHPSQLASSLHRMGVPYKIAYALNIALRYLPTVQREFQLISYAQQARGLHLSGSGVSLWKRSNRLLAILIPLVFSSLERVETVTNAMELRGFGRARNRTWYHESTFQTLDYIVCVISVFILALSIVLKLTWFQTFWYPGLK